MPTDLFVADPTASILAHVESLREQVSSSSDVEVDSATLKTTISQATPADLARFGVHKSSPANQEPPSTSEIPFQPENIEYRPLDFSSPAEFLAFFDDSINEGRVNLYTWQKELLEKLGKPSTSLSPREIALCAANGSGKDKYIIAPFAVWFAACKKKSRVIITSSSGTQLTSQTEGYIRQLCNAVNRFYGEEVFKINQRHIQCLASGSEIRLFATDEAGKAEGYHPWETDSEMAIIINEAKSVDEEIFKALTRCTGYNVWLEVSTPGQPSGHFHTASTGDGSTYEFFKVTAFMCPHLGDAYIKKAKNFYGENSPLYRSMILAEFTSVDGKTVITLDNLLKCRKTPVETIGLPWKRRAGLDLAAGGDENVLTILEGNKVIGQEIFILRDTTDTVEMMIKFFNKWELKPDNIFADDGGVGRSMIDLFHRRGWPVNRVLNQSRAINTREFANRGAELWFLFSRLVQECLIILPTDDIKLDGQLTNRYYSQSDTNGKICLESKAVARAHGHPSPDRADSLVLAFTGLTIEDFQDAKTAPRLEFGSVVTTINNTEELVEYHDNFKYGGFEKTSERKAQKEFFGSLDCLLFQDN
jgi:uncharacterized protein (DUF1499 family)